MTEYDLDFLKEKGFLETSINMEDKYDTAEGTVKFVSYLFDSKNRLAYFVDFNVEDIASILKVLREKRNFDYYWFWKEGRIYTFRTFGENKQFIFNTQHSRKTEYIKSKKDKLSKFSSDNPTALFDVKDVILRFYRNLWNLRLKLAKAVNNELDDRDKILAAQRLLDRLIFTYFIAEKGIIYGIDKRGNRQELSARNLFRYLIEVSGDFHSLLNVLFFDYLNDSKKNDMPIQGAEGYSLFIPYLNGGLFRERQITTPTGESIGESELEIEGFEWNDLIDALNEYNWIIDGYTDTEAEDTIGNLTPEILGHIYEKFVISVSELDDVDVDDLKKTKEGELKKGNKKIGAYYTPEAITKYIAENTIFPFAMDKLELDKKYENFADFHEAHNNDADTLNRFNEALKHIKVLDPAVGSGAFPMAAADILFDWRRKCREKLDDYHLRREIIINNLHGVDIMEGAVEICMLRLWLWLIASVDTKKEIEALPNIEFNVFEGNSLIGYVDEKEVVDLKPKNKPKARWDTLTHKQFTIDNWGEEGIFYLFQQRNDKIREYRNASGERAERLRSEIKQMTDEFNRLLDGKLLKELQNKGIDIDEDKLKELKPFHWVMQFSNVFEKGGFDVVIGNPPYVNAWEMEEGSKLIRTILPKLFNDKCPLKSHWDLYIPFIIQALEINSKQGYFSYILPNPICREKYGIEVRKYILENTNIKNILTSGVRNVFEGVSRQSIVLIIKNSKPKKVDNIISINYIDEDNNISILNSTKQSDWNNLFQCQFRYEMDSTSFDIISHIDKLKVRLGNIYYVNYGAQISSKEKGKFGKQYLLEKDPKENPKKFIEGKDLSRYSISDRGLYLDYLPKMMYGPRVPEFFESPKLITRHVSGKNDSLIFTIDKMGYYSDHGLIMSTDYENLNSKNRTSFSDYTVDSKHNYQIELLLGILNSKLMSFFYANVYATGSLQGSYSHVYPQHVRNFPISTKVKLSYSDSIVKIVYYLLFNPPNKNAIISNYFDQYILDSLVYSLYFSSNFTTVGIPTDLVDKIASYLEPINYDRWAQLEFKDKLTGVEMKEKQALEERNMTVIERVYQRLKNDKEIQGCIRQIKSHPWVKVVEGEA
ncbi:Eco57I restriction-modification methylase domain-containing protein [Methanococcoides burtonii]|uniref:site-specific DNA-methyltransferase (adenine-specific) n=1 Tax=Methanococcoides burtonii (strain DSM 6242 / NBRC 107633 / OCM 468 / ACE-M) TaxID=259564 RepID=Q12U44_METBU|nr:TaqI-like C-terminal specificity domain-containing protein [Methanococcoides burtonii]ABE53032.1 Protein with adenine-specific DNA methyltransferase domains [Methanococcoides burtonii DSM 6242]